MKNLMIIMILIGCSYSLPSKAGTVKFRYNYYQELIDINTVGPCVSETLIFKRKTTYSASFFYSKYYLMKKWLEDDNTVIPGSLENTVEKQGYKSNSSSNHSTEQSALNECALNQSLIKANALTPEEIQETIERFLRD